ncbi:hypothetical protein ANCCAN_16748 [Ancylostoma caninum]|uniref:Uncharacterized protein n=1 Tax=Ancylostoma caninum TaxID=29170 RepID=A0A368FYT2_ANCCA|nr:hypothetical protein ANCCAN_16748 [Ancylostoma caninum]
MEIRVLDQWHTSDCGEPDVLPDSYRPTSIFHSYNERDKECRGLQWFCMSGQRLGNERESRKGLDERKRLEKNAAKLSIEEKLCKREGGVPWHNKDYIVFSHLQCISKFQRT